MKRGCGGGGRRVPVLGASRPFGPDIAPLLAVRGSKPSPLTIALPVAPLAIGGEGSSAPG